MSEQRKDRRAPALLRVKYKSSTVEQFIEQFGTDISRGGIFIRTKKPLKLGSPLKLELQLQDASSVIHGVGRVTWRREPGAEGGGSAGMGIKFIKLAPDSRTLVERVVQARSGAPSRFEQTTGAEQEPAGASDAPPPMATPSSPAPTPSAAPARTSVGARAPAAGLFSDKTRSSHPPATPTDRTSFFPDAPAARPASRQNEQARHSSQFLATALSEGGASEEATAQARAEAARAQRSGANAGLDGIDDLLDQAFDELAGGAASAPAPRPSSRLPPTPPASRSPGRSASSAAPARPASAGLPAPPAAASTVDDVFASLNEPEAPAGGDVSAPPSTSTPDTGVTGAASAEDESIDELFASLNASEAQPAQDAVEDSVEDVFASLNEESGAAMPIGFGAEELVDEGQDARPFGAPGETILEDEDEDEDEDEETTDFPVDHTDEFGEFDLDPSMRPPSLSVGSAEQPRRGAPVATIVGALLVLIGGAAAWHLVGGGIPGLPPLARSNGAATTGDAHATAANTTATSQPGAPGAAGRGDALTGDESEGTAPAPTGKDVRVNFTSLPRGADLWIGGKKVATTPTTLALPGGVPVTITVSSTGYQSTSREVMPMDGIVPQRFKLEPLPFQLIVETEPLGAEVSVGANSVVSPAPLDLGHINGVISVSIAMEGYRRMTRPVRLGEFTQQGEVMVAKVPVKLSPLPGTVVPEWKQALEPRSANRKARERRRARARAKARAHDDEGPPAPEPAAATKDDEGKAEKEPPPAPAPEPAAEEEPPPAPEPAAEPKPEKEAPPAPDEP